MNFLIFICYYGYRAVGFNQVIERIYAMKFTNSEEPKKVKILTANSKEISEHLVVPQGNDTMMTGDLLEISSSGNIISVDKTLWNAWTGRRYINGDEFHGPVFMIKTETPFTGNRVCICASCQPNIASEFRPN